MKKHITLWFWSCLATSLAFSPVFAQSNKQAIPAAFASPQTTTVAGNINATSPSFSVNEKVQRAFERNFGEVAAPFWCADGQRLVASFKMGDRQGLASFNKSGHLYYVILNGMERHLPTAEKAIVQSAYRDYDIKYTQEITLNDLKLWVVSLENCNNILKVRVMDGDVYELQRYQRDK